MGLPLFSGDLFEMLARSLQPLLICWSKESLSEIQTKRTFQLTPTWGIEAILLQEQRQIEFMSEKLGEARQKWTIYEMEFYTTYKAVKRGGNTIWQANNLFFKGSLSPQESESPKAREINSY